MKKPSKQSKKGRPPKAPEDRRSKLVRILTTEAEYEELRSASEEAGMSLSTWARVAALEKARGR